MARISSDATDPPPQLGRLLDPVLSLLAERSFDSAKVIIESLLALGYRSPMVLLAYAVCLTEMGHGDRAAAIVEEIQQLFDEVRVPGEAKLRAALAAIRERLPGQRWDPGCLSSSAEEAWRDLPIARKPKVT